MRNKGAGQVVKDFLRKAILLGLDNLGINALFRFFNRNKTLIIWYHGVCADGFELLTGYDERHIQQSFFRKQLEFLRQKKYVFATLTDLIAALEKKKRTSRLVALTFDDGFRNVVENAYPLMRQFNAKGCFYLVSGLIGTQQLLWTDFIETIVRNERSGEFRFNFKGNQVRYIFDNLQSRENAMRDIKRKLRTISNEERLEHLRQFNHKSNDFPREFLFADWEQINGLDQQILEIGSHTRNHPDCRSLRSDEEFEDEILNSKLDIERMTHHKISSFCYPGSSSFDEKVIASVNTYVKKYGYQSAVSTVPGLNDENSDCFMLKRVCATEDYLLFKATTSGSYMALKSFGKMIFGWLSKFSRAQRLPVL
jgi:peptidoglycan/xylan/chitin deacetylase (PgdA/CDA1 family)